MQPRYKTAATVELVNESLALLGGLRSRTEAELARGMKIRCGFLWLKVRYEPYAADNRVTSEKWLKLVTMLDAIAIELNDLEQDKAKLDAAQWGDRLYLSESLYVTSLRSEISAAFPGVMR